MKTVALSVVLACGFAHCCGSIDMYYPQYMRFGGEDKVDALGRIILLVDIHAVKERNVPQLREVIEDAVRSGTPCLEDMGVYAAILAPEIWEKDALDAPIPQAVLARLGDPERVRDLAVQRRLSRCQEITPELDRLAACVRANDAR